MIWRRKKYRLNTFFCHPFLWGLKRNLPNYSTSQGKYTSLNQKQFVLAYFILKVLMFLLKAYFSFFVWILIPPIAFRYPANICYIVELLFFHFIQEKVQKELFLNMMFFLPKSIGEKICMKRYIYRITLRLSLN